MPPVANFESDNNCRLFVRIHCLSIYNFTSIYRVALNFGGLASIYVAYVLEATKLSDRVLHLLSYISDLPAVHDQV